MHNQARQEKIPTPSKLADNLIGSLGGLTAVDRAELRRQVVMLINHSYALGYSAGAGVGLVARIRSKFSRACAKTGQGFKLALSSIRERLTMIFRGQDPRSRQMLATAFVIRYPMRGEVTMADDEFVKYLHINRPAALLPPATDWSHRNQTGQHLAGHFDQGRQKAPEGESSDYRVTRELGRPAAPPQHFNPAKPAKSIGSQRDQDAYEINLERFHAKKQPGNNPTVSNHGRHISNRAGILPGLNASRPY